MTNYITYDWVIKNFLRSFKLTKFPANAQINSVVDNDGKRYKVQKLKYSDLPKAGDIFFMRSTKDVLWKELHILEYETLLDNSYLYCGPES